MRLPRSLFVLALLAALAGCTAKPTDAVQLRPESGFAKGSPLAVAVHPRDDLGLKEKLESALRAKGFNVVAKPRGDAYLFSYEFEADLTGGFEPQFTLEKFLFQVARAGEAPAATGQFSQNATALGWKKMDEAVAQIVQGLAVSLDPPPAKRAK